MEQNTGMRITQAEVLRTDVQYLRRGDMFLPDHRLAYCALFRTQEGEELLLEVPQPVFEQLHPCQADELAWQGSRFIQFGTHSA